MKISGNIRRIYRNFIYVELDTDQEKVELIVSKYDLNVISDVNNRQIMLGIITIDDIVDVIVEEQTEDVLKWQVLLKKKD